MEEEEDDDAESDETIDYNDLFVDESSWSWLSAEQKLCSNTGAHEEGIGLSSKCAPAHSLD